MHVPDNEYLASILAPEVLLLSYTAVVVNWPNFLRFKLLRRIGKPHFHFFCYALSGVSVRCAGNNVVIYVLMHTARCSRYITNSRALRVGLVWSIRRAVHPSFNPPTPPPPVITRPCHTQHYSQYSSVFSSSLFLFPFLVFFCDFLWVAVRYQYRMYCMYARVWMRYKVRIWPTSVRAYALW